MLRKILIPLGLAILTGQQAQAATATNTLTVQINIAAACVVAASTLDFGSGVGLLSAAINQSTTISVTCTFGTTYTVGLDQGANFVVTNRMKGGVSNSEFVSYALYQDAGHGTAFTDSGGGRVSGTGTGAAQAINVFGQVPAQTTPSPGGYADQVTITVTY
jgi:spore coat protein U-like protein